MSVNPEKQYVLVIVGPTAVGKTELSIKLAKQIAGEIISADSRLFYRGMDIGTAKPSKAEMAEIPHHLVDCANPQDIWSLAIYRQRVNECIEDIISRNRIPIIAGGTGQYIRAVTQGWVLPIQPPNDKLRSALQAWSEDIGSEAIYAKLKIIDPMAAAEIDSTNVRRTIRALEVIFLTGKLFSEQRLKAEPLHQFWIIGLNRPRKELYERIDKRIEEMFVLGLVEETRGLIDQGISINHPNLSAIGYREVGDYLNNAIDLNQAKALMKKKTREFVRRQRNWFKPDDPNIHWYDMSDETLKYILNDLRIAKIIE